MTPLRRGATYQTQGYHTIKVILVSWGLNSFMSAAKIRPVRPTVCVFSRNSRYEQSTSQLYAWWFTMGNRKPTSRASETCVKQQPI